MAETAKTRRNMQRWTRRSASTIGGAAPDSIIGRAAADRAGARPYQPPATSHYPLPRLINPNRRIQFLGERLSHRYR
jgi:hypothetical protein